ncbi:MAG TPA: hydroxymethylpyrimidine/phosphomethylpyrimidine kinase, partial [Ruminococcus sp.]|nr:hydroxymethylpyrimidine/phosphomethylpyrimidine kinase [Ruminococcus sp.]
MIERVPVLTIAGSDSCGGAGIQADLKTMTALYVYGMSAITALTAQNTLGVQGILPVSADFLGQQLDAICTDIPPEAVKIGMIASPEQVDVICAKIQQYHLKKVVVDPVMVATTGAELTERTTVDAMREQLFAQADLLTPNLSETAVLLGKTV